MWLCVGLPGTMCSRAPGLEHSMLRAARYCSCRSPMFVRSRQSAIWNMLFEVLSEMIEHLSHMVVRLSKWCLFTLWAWATRQVLELLSHTSISRAVRSESRHNLEFESEGVMSLETLDHGCNNLLFAHVQVVSVLGLISMPRKLCCLVFCFADSRIRRT